jgi:GxxExxY protein
MHTDVSLIEGQTSRVVIGAFYSVYNELGSGFLEQVYENAMLIALRGSGLAVEQQTAIQVVFRGSVVGHYRADLLVPARMLIEIKAARTLTPADDSQLLHYLKATGLAVGLLLNFGPKPQFRRRINFNRSRSV